MSAADDVRLIGDVVFSGRFVIESACIIGCGPDGVSTMFGDDIVIRAGTYIYAGNKIGAGFRTGNKVNIREFNDIGDNVSIGTLSVIEHHVKIGDNVRIHSQAFIPEYSIIENNVWIGPNVVLTNARYPNNAATKDNLQGPVLGEGCIIGANATILPGVSIGADSLVGAGTVVTKDLPPNSVAVGNPARIKSKKSEIRDYAQHD